MEENTATSFAAPITSLHPIGRSNPGSSYSGDAPNRTGWRSCKASCSTEMQIYDPLLWGLKALGLLVAFRMQGALLKGAQDHWSRRWAVGLRRAMGATVLLNAKPLLHDD